jgi:PAS domain S-box-containing protein
MIYMKFSDKREKLKITLMGILLAYACLLTYYFHAIRKTGSFFTHFFYIPIIISSLWWKRKGMVVAVFLAAFLIASDYVFQVKMLTADDYPRAAMFIIISLVVALLSENLSKIERGIKRTFSELNQIFNTAGHGMTVIDKDFNVLLVNERFARLAGISEEETKGKKCYEIFPDSLCHTYGCPLTRIVGGEERVECDVEKERRDGSSVPCIVTATPFRGPDGELLGIVEDLKDITERKQTEKTLKESEDKYRTIFETTGTATMIVEEDAAISMVNTEFEKIFGFAKEEIEGTQNWDKFIVEDALVRMGEYHEMRRNNPNVAPWNYEVRGIDKGGNLKDLFLSISVIPETKKSVVSILDITDRKRAEQERVLLATAIEQAAEGITIIDRDGIIQYANPASERISGYTREELIGQNHSILRSSKYDKEFYEAMMDKLSRGEMWTGPMLNERKDGTPYKVEASISPIRDNTGTIVYYVMIARDVTREAELETQLRQVQKMEAIGTLAGGIAHDFNNILAAIMGYTEMALYDAPEGTSGRRNLEQVLKAGYRGKDLVKQIITFSRRRDEERRPMQISPIVKEALKLLRASLPTTIDIRQNIKSQSGMVLADPTQIHQVLMNLISNAAYAMREKGGVLEVSLTDVDINPDGAAPPHLDLKPGPYLKLTVSDTGHGIDHAIIERIFDPFFTTKRPGEGTGMGLAVVHGIVKSYGGAILVDSEPDKGSTFDVFFPRIEGSLLPEVDSAAPMPTGNERILFVDDEEALADMVEQMLKRLGYSVDTKTSSLDALEAFKTQSDDYDLVITDQTMPHMAGVDLAREIMHISPEIPIILCTGFSEVISAEEAKALGIHEFLMKPFATRALAETIRRALDSKK